MIEAYLRANNMFVDYNEVRVFLYSLYFIFVLFKVYSLKTFLEVTLTDSPKFSLNKKEHTPLIYNWILRMLNLVFQGQRGIYSIHAQTSSHIDHTSNFGSSTFLDRTIHFIYNCYLLQTS
jgi:hypothetical protein